MIVERDEESGLYLIDGIGYSEKFFEFMSNRANDGRVFELQGVKPGNVGITVAWVDNGNPSLSDYNEILYNGIHFAINFRISKAGWLKVQLLKFVFGKRAFRYFVYMLSAILDAAEHYIDKYDRLPVRDKNA